MSRYIGRFTENGKPSHQQSPRTGVLLINLGTPKKPTPNSLRNYLREFLSDPRVVEIPRLLWLTILHGIILRTRPAKSAKLYQNIWSEKGSPLAVISQQQQTKMAAIFAKKYGSDVIVDFAMRYGKPSIANALQNFQQQGVNNIIVLPLYPQHAGPTTASAFDAVTKEIKQWRWIPSLHFISSYHDDLAYIDALANTVKEDFARNGKPEKLILSYHGMPKLFQQWGDPYFDFCQKTTQLLVATLGLNENEYVMTFQSRFGKAQWLTPYTETVLTDLPKQGIKNIAIISPAFSADCLETLDEIEREYREVFIRANGEKYRYIGALNDRDDHINALAGLIEPHIQLEK